jgi:hypothetical protein
MAEVLVELVEGLLKRDGGEKVKGRSMARDGPSQQRLPEGNRWLSVGEGVLHS